MKKIIFILLLIPAVAGADWVVETCNGQWKSSATYFNDSQLASDANCVRAKMSDADWKVVFDGMYAPDLTAARSKKLAEIQNQEMVLYNQYALYSTVQSVIDYGAALRAVSATATTEMAVLPDVASVKNYQPAWPTKPNL